MMLDIGTAWTNLGKLEDWVGSGELANFMHSPTRLDQSCYFHDCYHDDFKKVIDLVGCAYVVYLMAIILLVFVVNGYSMLMQI